MGRIPRLAGFAALAVVLPTAFGQAHQGTSGDPMYRTTADDPVMNAAKAYARRTLPGFWRHWQHPAKGESDFSVKVRVEDESGVEYFWVVDLAKKRGRLLGTINNDPEVVHKVHLGQRILIKDRDIGDWCYLRNQKVVGNYTLRAVLKSMSGEEAAELRKHLAPP